MKNGEEKRREELQQLLLLTQQYRKLCKSKGLDSNPVYSKKFETMTKLAILAKKAEEKIETIKNTLISTQETTSEELGNKLQLDLTVDFVPAQLRVFSPKKTTILTIDTQNTPTPFAKSIPIDKFTKREKYLAVAYDQDPEKNNDCKRTPKKFLYKGETEVIIRVLTESSLKEEKKDAKIDALRIKIKRQLDQKLSQSFKIIFTNSQVFIDNFSAFYKIILPYTSLPENLDTQRKIIASTTSAFAQTLVSVGMLATAGKIKKAGIIAVSTEAGASVFGLYGAIIGFFSGVALDIIVNKAMEKYILPSVDDMLYEERSKAVEILIEAKKSEILLDAEIKIDELHNIHQKDIAFVNKMDSIEELTKLLAEVSGKLKIKALKKNDRSLFTSLLKSWTFTNAGDDADDPGNAITDIRPWENALKKLGKSTLSCQTDVYLYQIQGIMPLTGLDTSYINSLRSSYNDAVQTVLDLIEKGQLSGEGTPDGSDPAYEELYQIVAHSSKKQYNSGNLKIKNSKEFINFHLATMQGKAEVDRLRYFLEGFLEQGSTNQFQFTLTLDTKLTYDQGSIFGPELKWSIQTTTDEYFSGGVTLDNDK